MSGTLSFNVWDFYQVRDTPVQYFEFNFYAQAYQQRSLSCIVHMSGDT